MLKLIDNKIFSLSRPMCMLSNTKIEDPVTSHRVGGNRKRYQQSTNVDKKIDRNGVFNCHLSPVWRQMANTGDKWQSKTLFLTIFDLRSLIALAFLIAVYPV